MNISATKDERRIHNRLHSFNKSNECPLCVPAPIPDEETVTLHLESKPVPESAHVIVTYPDGTRKEYGNIATAQRYVDAWHVKRARAYLDQNIGTSYQSNYQRVYGPNSVPLSAQERASTLWIK